MKILTHIRGNPIRKNRIENLPYNKKLKALLPDKRKAGLLCEVLFWKQVHRRRFHQIDFDRQKIIGNYIVDFYVKSLGLAIEIDGWSHDFKQEYDKKRQSDLESYGVKVFRISNHDIKNNMVIVIRDLENFIMEHYGVREPDEWSGAE